MSGRVRQRGLAWVGVLLGLVVAVAAGAEGTTRFTGPRWVPHLSPGPLNVKPRPSTPPSSDKPPAVIGSDRLHVGALVLWIAVGVAAVVVAVLVWRWLSRRPIRGKRGRAAGAGPAVTAPVPVPGIEAEPDVPVVRRGVEHALRLLIVERDPADAVMKAWLGLQQTAEDSGIVRGPAETPTEFTTRILSRVFADDRAIQTLLELYQRTRFGAHPVTSADVARAQAALRELADTWDAGAGSLASGRARG